jgi:hypothetical protein
MHNNPRRLAVRCIYPGDKAPQVYDTNNLDKTITKFKTGMKMTIR